MVKKASSILVIIIGFLILGAKGMIGINWGRLNSQRLIPSMVVDLLLQNGIKHVRIFNSRENVLEAFSGSGIDLTVGFSNNVLKTFTNQSAAVKWVEQKVIRYKNVNIRYVTIGTEPFSLAFKKTTYDNALDVMKYVQNALNGGGLGRTVKVTIPHYTDVLKLNETSRPSDAEFRDDIKEKMVDSIRFLQENNAPFMAGIFPIHHVLANRLDLEFAFMDSKSKYVVKDDVSGHVYTNAFDYLFDSYHWAVSKAGGKNLTIMVSLIGWPTDGYMGANIANAQRFYKSFLPFVTSNKGTPMRPGAPIDVYLHSLTDENLNHIDLGGFQRHWGIYKFNGEPKYKIDFSGQDRDIFPTTAKGVTRMPKRWCVFNGNNGNQSKVDYEYNLACNMSDCTSLEPGGSCGNLNKTHQISYAFNMHFQAEAQTSLAKKACDMQGLGKIVPDDPSIGTCIFPIEILAAENAVKISLGSSILKGFSDDGLWRLGAGLPILVTLVFLIIFSI